MNLEQLKKKLRKNPEYRKLDDAVERIMEAQNKIEKAEAIFDLLEITEDHEDEALEQQKQELIEEIEKQRKTIINGDTFPKINSHRITHNQTLDDIISLIKNK